MRGEKATQTEAVVWQKEIAKMRMNRKNGNTMLMIFIVAIIYRISTVLSSAETYSGAPKSLSQ